MPIRKMSSLLVVSLVLMICLLAVPTGVEAQCNVINTMSYTTFAPATINITKTLSAPTACKTTAMMAFFCFPSGTFFTTDMLLATRNLSSPNPYCNWSCGCGTGPAPHVTTSTADGLPVELMEFEISESDTDGVEEEDENAASD